VHHASIRKREGVVDAFKLELQGKEVAKLLGSQYPANSSSFGLSGVLHEIFPCKTRIFPRYSTVLAVDA
jgi:hypothetical protein